MRLPFRSLFGGSRRARSGATAVEFSIMALPFFMLIWGMLELGQLLLAMAGFEHGVSEAARRIRTGEVAVAKMTKSDLEDMVCDNMLGLSKCSASSLRLDIQTFPDFDSLAGLASPIADGALDDDETGFDIGAERDIILVRAYYIYDIRNPLMSPMLSNWGAGKHMMSSVTAFRNEPFGEPE